MKLEISSLVAKSKVVLYQFGLSSVKCHLVTSQPARIAQNSRGMHNWALKVNVAGQVDKVPLVAGLQLAALLARVIIRNTLLSTDGVSFLMKIVCTVMLYRLAKISVIQHYIK